MARIYKRGKVWYSDLFINGKRVQKALSGDKKIAEERLGELVKQRGAVKYGYAPTSNTYAIAKERFLKVYTFKSPITHRHYLRTFKEIEDILPVRELPEITPDRLTDVLAQWKIKGKGLYVRNRNIENIVCFMRRAERWGMVRPQDWDTVEGKDEEPRGRLLFYTAKELIKLLKTTKGLWKTFTMLGARAGLRPGEAFYLEWPDIDFATKKLHVDSKPSHGWHVKTYERRTIPMPPDLVSYLRQLPHYSNFVIAWEDGSRPKSMSSTAHNYSKRVKRAGLKGSLYTLRHSYASHLVQAGVPLQTVRDLLGHRSITTTEIYSHLIPEMHQEAVNRLPVLQNV